MTADVSITNKPDGVPDRATWTGRDAAGREHWQTGALPRGTMLVTDGERIVERVELPAREHTTDTRLDTVADWLEHVADRCGWSRRAGDVDLVGRLADGVEEGHDR